MKTKKRGEEKKPLENPVTQKGKGESNLFDSSLSMDIEGREGKEKKKDRRRKVGRIAKRATLEEYCTLHLFSLRRSLEADYSFWGEDSPWLDRPLPLKGRGFLATGAPGQISNVRGLFCSSGMRWDFNKKKKKKKNLVDCVGCVCAFPILHPPLASRMETK